MKSVVIAKLFARAGGLCSRCKTNLFQEEVKIGEMAHIIGQSNDGPRGNEPYEEDRDSYDNLILLCSICHTIVDNNIENYPVDELRTIKRDHENWVAVQLSHYSNKHLDINGLQTFVKFAPILHVPSMITFLPNVFMPGIMEIADIIDTFPIDNPQCRPFSDATLEAHYSEFTSKFCDLYNQLTGTINETLIYEQDENSSQFILKLNPHLQYSDK